jgi:F0F1-type ATP synthase membrane subunit a
MVNKAPIFANMAASAVILKLTYYFGFWRYRHFEFLAIWRTGAVILNLTCYYFEFSSIWRPER